MGMAPQRVVSHVLRKASHAQRGSYAATFVLRLSVRSLAAERSMGPIDATDGTLFATAPLSARAHIHFPPLPSGVQLRVRAISAMPAP